MCKKAGTLYVDKFVPISDEARVWDTIKYDKSGNPLSYFEYLIRYNLASIQQAVDINYNCTEKDGEPVGFYIKNELDIDEAAHDFNFYLSSVPKDERILIASRWAGVEGGAWSIPFRIFKEKNWFFELNLTVDMLKNMASSYDSEPVVGFKAKGAKSFDIIQAADEFWNEILGL